MRPIRAFSIRAKLVTMVMLTTVPALLLAGFSLGISEVISARRTLRHELQAMADIIGTNSTAPLAFRDPTTGQEILSALVSQPAVVSACLYDQDHGLFSSYRRPGYARDCPTRPGPVGGTFEADHFVLWQPVALHGEELGTLGMVAELGELSRRLRSFSLIMATVLIGSALAALLFSTRLQRLVSQPILELASTAKSVSERTDYSLRAPKHSDDEIGSAVEAFNQMLLRIQVADEALREAGEASRTQARLLRSIVDNMGEGLLVCDQNGRFTLWNPAADRIVGRGPSEQGPESWPREFQLYRDEQGTPLDAKELPLVRAIGGEAVTDFEMYVRPPQGGGLWISATARPMRDEAGTPRGALVVIRDVSERKRAGEELRSLNATLEERVAERTAAAEQRAQELHRSNQELEQFANIASHDLQEPLRAVASYTQLLDERLGPLLDAENHIYMDHIVSAVTRMRALIKDLLEYSRIGRRVLQIIEVNTEEILATTLADLSFAIKEADAIVTHGPMPKVPADPIQLGRLFQNLIANALKFRREGPPEIMVSALQKGDFWEFAVRDNGIGIDARHHERIFVIFQRLHGRSRPGTGIGLAICRKIVERHSGRIWVESELGRGATFFFTLPVRRAKDA